MYFLGVSLLVVGILVVFWSPNDTSATTTTTTAPANTTTVTTESRVVASDTAVAAILGIGTALLVVGVFYPRITKVVFPGGEIDIGAPAPASAEQVKEAEKALQATKQANAGVDALKASAMVNVLARKFASMERVSKIDPKSAEAILSPDDVKSLQERGLPSQVTVQRWATDVAAAI
jgi:hypothetical protein